VTRRSQRYDVLPVSLQTAAIANAVSPSPKITGLTPSEYRQREKKEV
jgi:hypothetical protein